MGQAGRATSEESFIRSGAARKAMSKPPTAKSMGWLFRYKSQWTRG